MSERPLYFRTGAGGSCEIEVGRGVWETLFHRGFWKRVAWVVTEPFVRKTWGERLEALAKHRGIALRWIECPRGEAAKSLDVVQQVCQRLLSQQVSCRETLLVVGGGAITDVGGMIAGIYGRSMTYVSVPTTLLGMVDAAIGGKTAVNVGGVKNAVGLLYFPQLVCVDLDCLKTLPFRLRVGGWAEMVKIAMGCDGALWEQLTHQPVDLLGDLEALEPLVGRSIELKVRCVNAGNRTCLNLGHTVGHALESLQEDLEHGEAVLYGLYVELEIAQHLGLLSPSLKRALQRALTAVPLPALKPPNMEDFLNVARRDKKGQGTLAFVALQELGKTSLVPEVEPRLFSQGLESCLKFFQAIG